MTPLLFGSGERRLFGVYDPARSGVRGNRAAVICPPWGDEYIYAHRTLRQLATRLAQNGFHVLRFDYFGTGDSAGETGDNDATGSRNDIEAAIAELKDIAGVAKATLIGLRLGACLAADVAAVRADDVDDLVIWDPLTSDGLKAIDLADGLEAPKNFVATDLASLRRALPDRTLIVSTQDQAPKASKALPVHQVASAPPWIEERMQTGEIPVNVLQYILEWLR